MYIDYVTIDNGPAIQAEGPSTIIDWGTGLAAFDWQNIVSGQEAINQNGALRFVYGSQAFAANYDSNGNMITRLVNGARYFLSYDTENRLVGVTGAVAATFVYDRDGNRVKGTVAGVSTSYIGNPSVPSGQAYFEWKSSTSDMKKYYYAGSTKVAMRTGSSTINYLLGDHLGSNAITTTSGGVKYSEIRYMAWGTTRYSSGTSPTTYQYTGQRVESSLGLLFYNARWYDPHWDGLCKRIRWCREACRT